MIRRILMEAYVALVMFLVALLAVVICAAVGLLVAGVLQVLAGGGP